MRKGGYPGKAELSGNALSPARHKEVKIIPIAVGDTLTLKKKHPCGSDSFTVTRVGSDIGMRCSGCARDVMTPRVKLEKAIKRVNGIPAQQLAQSAAGPSPDAAEDADSTKQDSR